MTADTLKVYEFNKGVKKEIQALSKLDNWHCFIALLEDYFFIGISMVATYYTNWYFYQKGRKPRFSKLGMDSPAFCSRFNWLSVSSRK